MSYLDEIKDKMDIGIPILNELFKLDSKELKAKVRDILGESWIEDHCSGIIENGMIRKVIVDDRPRTIQIFYYDEIYIGWSGIYFHPEHGEKTLIREFDKYFHLPNEK